MTTALAGSLGVAGTAPAFAQEAEAAGQCKPGVDCPTAEEILLDTITVSVNRTKKAPVNTLASVSVVRLNDDDTRPAATTYSDIFNGMPGVTARMDGDDPGASVNIRGLEGFGRVAMIIDGARQNFQQTGHGPNGAFYLDPSLLDEVTVMRGPVANAYGSGAIGGVVYMRTISPSDFLHDDETWAAKSRTVFGTNGAKAETGLTGAYRISDAFSVLGSFNVDRSSDFKDGDGDKVYNSGERIHAGLLKAEIKPADFHTVTLGYLGNQFDYDTGAETATQYDTSVYEQVASARWEYDNPDDRLFNIDASVFYTGTKKDETYLTGANVGLGRSFDIDTAGFNIANTSRFEAGGLAHAVTIGGDFFQDDVETWDEAGAGGDLYTPSGKRKAYGAFIEDAVSYSNWLEVIGGLRFDGYTLDSSAASTDGSRLSPKITVGVKPFEETVAAGLQIYGSYAEGYRAPSTTETLITGTHPGFASFNFLPNPNLKPETAHNFEIGVNYARNGIFTADDKLRLKAAWFHNRVDNFIDADFNFTGNWATSTYQYVNIGEGTLKGFEIEGMYDAGAYFGGISASVIDGTNEDTGEALATVPAAKIVTTAGMRFLERRLSLGAQLESVFAQDDVPSTVSPSDAYNLVNLFASWQATDNLSLGLEVKNLLDETYTEYLSDQPSAGVTVLFSLNARLGG
ncbi:TonB-dependent hemoglobin/transferrin/lactoferrin family receptor [Hartmannibacter diazotrophicus]|uniref:TonB-dependent hemoglobin/transferrin/lactoferrin family receptor n=1 Tax=Hartmannibacter diazotrophicus TaxID=1482074 RepID=UPI0012FD5DEE|nr:TonB-dependent hemoglobin/transferrin/lactoferrin family receptor [Hartmannibacter diazotrophicus]